MDSGIALGKSHVSFYQVGYRVCKRVFDLAICILTLPFTLPIMGFCALLVILDSPGPAIFIQERIGKQGEAFRLYKFRTMPVNVENDAHRAFMKAFVKGEIGGDKDETLSDLDPERAFTSAFPGADPNAEAQANTTSIYKPLQYLQITKVGQALRKLSLDELPQIFNVIKGDMSLVGPRPNVPWEVEAYLPWHYRRLEVLPGITGLAQVKGRSGLSFKRIVTYDIEYIENQSPLMDLKILWSTVAAVIFRKGAK
ncbi:MAG: sugar transferase [Anaerolineae bacterium]|nr:sugar transferase [Anaerolineae bacterium]